MTKSFNRRIPALLILAGLISGMFACTKTDPFFANDMVPPHQSMETRIDSSFHVKTSLFALDSVSTSNLGQYVNLGSYIHPLIGRTTINVFSNFFWESYDGEISKLFGPNPIIDCLNLVIIFPSAPIGDTLIPLHVDVYEVIGHPFIVDSTYYSNFDMSPYIGSTPLTSFDVTTEVSITKTLPLYYAEKLAPPYIEGVTDPETYPYPYDDVFNETINGLYFKATPLTSGEGLIRPIDLNNIRLNLFWHTPENDSVKQMRYYLYMDYSTYQTSFQMVEFDYNYADPSQGGITPQMVGDKTIETEYTYTAGFGGLGTLITIPMDKVRELKEKALAEGYSNIGIHKAELIFDVADPTISYYDNAFKQLTLYFDFLDRKFLPEYNPILEASSVTNYESYIGGYVNRSRGQYALDISSYMQRLITGNFDQTELQLLPAYEVNNSLKYSWTYGSASANPPKLIITYTMLK